MNYLTLFLLIPFASAFVQDVRGSSVIKTSVGTTVTLLSEAISLPLSSIEWYIFNNKTLIAVFFKPDFKTDMYPPLKGRLSLDTTTGNLEIRNVTLEDSRTYTVKTQNMKNDAHTYEVTLSVFARLPEPTLDEINSTRVGGLCWVSLRCSVSSSSGVKFKWSPDPLPRGCGWDLKDNSIALTAPEATSVRSAWCSPNRTVTINCTASDSVSNTSSAKSVNCSAIEKNHDKLQKVYSENSTGWIFFGLLAIGFIGYCFKGTWSNWRKPTQAKDAKSTQTEQGSFLSTQCGAEPHYCKPSESNDIALELAASNKEEDPLQVTYQN